jgi:hypothetical protein
MSNSRFWLTWGWAGNFIQHYLNREVDTRPGYLTGKWMDGDRLLSQTNEILRVTGLYPLSSSRSTYQMPLNRGDKGSHGVSNDPIIFALLLVCRRRTGGLFVPKKRSQNVKRFPAHHRITR